MKYLLIAIVSILVLGCQPSKTPSDIGNQVPNGEVASLRDSLLEIIKPYKARVGIAIKHLEKGDTLSINEAGDYPMQSVFKFAQALLVLKHVDSGKLNLKQKIHVGKEDIKFRWNVLYEKYPRGGVDLTIAELLEFALSHSDNNSCELLFARIGGPAALEKYIGSLGIPHFIFRYNDTSLHDGEYYYNRTSPASQVQLLELFYKGSLLSDSSSLFLANTMIESVSGPKRIKGLLPEGTQVAHKTGTSGTNEKGVTLACNDVGVILLPDGSHLAIAVFVNNSEEDFETSQLIIAKVARAVYDHFE